MRSALTPIDAAWLRMEEPGNAVDVTAVLVFDGVLPAERLRGLLLDRLLAHDRFRQRVREGRLGLGRPRWEDEPGFSLEAHLHRDTLAPPGGRAELEQLVGRWMNRPFDWSRSPWRLVVIDGHRHGTALLAQLHHCMGDGFALMEVLLSLADGRSEEVHTPMRAAAARRLAGDGARLRDAPRVAARAAHDLAHLLGLSFDTPSALRGHLGGVRRAAWADPIPLARVQSIAHARRCTVNDVVLGTLAGALRRYLDERGDRVSDLEIRAIVPVNLRPKGVPIDLEHGNWFGLVFVDLPIATRDPLARLAITQAEIDRIKHSREPAVSLAILDLVGRLPGRAGRALDRVFARKSSVVVTNVPGPRERLRFHGVPLRDIVFWVPHPSRLALGVSVLSYAGELRVGARSDGAVIADPERIVALFEAELLSLELGATTASSAPPPAARAR